MCKKIVLVGGGTGGHAVPLVNLAQYIRNTNPDIQLLWIGERGGIEEALATKNSIPFSSIVCGKLRRYFSPKTILLPFQIIIGTFQTFKILFIQSPKDIFSKGGYVSIPVAIAGWILRIPIYMHESDSVAGLANRIVAKFATGIFCSFEEAKNCFPPKKILGVGPLLPLELIELMTKGRNEDNERWETNILVSCGSQGSASIFEELVSILNTHNQLLKTCTFHIILGTQNPQFKEKFSIFSNVTTYDFFYDQKEYIELVNSCDLVITRSGSSVFEFDALGIQMIMIPHPFTGNNHQYWNAKAFEKKGHTLLEQKELSKLGKILLGYRDFHKNPAKKLENIDIFHTITSILLK